MKIVTTEKPYLVHITMKKLEELLPAEQFVRAHKSYMVALKAIRLLKPDELVLTNNAVVPVSINYRDAVSEKFRS